MGVAINFYYELHNAWCSKRSAIRCNLIWLRDQRLSPQCSREHAYSINNSVVRTCTLAINADTGHAGTRSFKNRLQKLGQLLAQGFCCVDRVGVQTRVPACSPVLTIPDKNTNLNISVSWGCFQFRLPFVIQMTVVSAKSVLQKLTYKLIKFLIWKYFSDTL